MATTRGIGPGRVLELIEAHTTGRTLGFIGEPGVNMLELLDAVLARRPDVVLVDELAHTNVPGSRHVKRWQDIEVPLDAGITVLTTVNIQHPRITHRRGRADHRGTAAGDGTR